MWQLVGVLAFQGAASDIRAWFGLSGDHEDVFGLA